MKKKFYSIFTIRGDPYQKKVENFFLILSLFKYLASSFLFISCFIYNNKFKTFDIDQNGSLRRIWLLTCTYHPVTIFRSLWPMVTLRPSSWHYRPSPSTSYTCWKLMSNLVDFCCFKQQVIWVKKIGKYENYEFWIKLFKPRSPIFLIWPPNWNRSQSIKFNTRWIYSKSFVFDQLPSPLPNFGIVFKVIIDISPPFK
jgi:hypothetical protein